MMDLVDALAASPEPLNLKRLASLTGLHTSTAHRILAMMVEHRVVDRVEPGSYRLGTRLMELGHLVKSRIDLRAEYSKSTILTTRESNEDIEEWKAGFSLLF